MEILYIQDYDAHRRVASGMMPSHHLFGMDMLVDHYCNDCAVIKSEFGGGRIDFITAGHLSLIGIVKLYFIAQKYDVVYDVLNVVSRYFGLANKWCMFRPKLVTFLHHPPFGKQLSLAKSDINIFFSPQLLNEGKIHVTDNRLLVCNRWYPDVEWYKRISTNMNYKKKFDYLDNGKTSRDHNMFIRCMRSMPGKMGCIVTDKNHIPSEYKDGDNVVLFLQDKPNDLTMVELCMQSKVMVIPLHQTHLAVFGPIGNTSYMDAIALGMPVVTNDYAAFADEIISYKLGEVYSFNDKCMVEAMKEVINNYEIFKRNMNQFAINHNIVAYSQKIQEMIF